MPKTILAVSERGLNSSPKLAAYIPFLSRKSSSFQPMPLFPGRFALRCLQRLRAIAWLPGVAFRQPVNQRRRSGVPFVLAASSGQAGAPSVDINRTVYVVQRRSVSVGPKKCRSIRQFVNTFIPTFSFKNSYPGIVGSLATPFRTFMAMAFAGCHVGSALGRCVHSRQDTLP